MNRGPDGKELQNAGDIVTVGDDEARRLIEAGQAVNVVKPAPAVTTKRASRKKA